LSIPLLILDLTILGRLLHPLGLFSLQNIDQVCQYARSDFAVGRDSDEDEQMKICACIIQSTTAREIAPELTSAKSGGGKSGGTWCH
jgi:hypothetical protein